MFNYRSTLLSVILGAVQCVIFGQEAPSAKLKDFRLNFLQRTELTEDVQQIKLKDYRPVSIYKTPQSKIPKAKYPAIDLHTHDNPRTDADVDRWVQLMDEVGIDKSVILSYSTGAAFDAMARKYARYPSRFEVWCGFDYTGMDQPDWSQRAVAELVRCYQSGARGVGELGDKGLGELYSKPTPGRGMHINDPRMKPLLMKCGELGMPISIHVAEDAWMYLPSDSTNDGLMNAAKWRVDMTKEGILNHDQLITTLEEAVRDNPRTTFIACHLANCNADLSQLARLLDAYPNLYADISARFAEFAPIPRFAKAFMEKYSDRLVYGTDMGFSREMYLTTFRILESADEHFYEHNRFGYHWPLYGLSLSPRTLKKIYQTNARKILRR
ncbi:amidohydrolase family protein [Runella sp. CRIBMP]|uniref:amidohydrolase family protein n=1 Tax=Runella sp. CRIBMP TaxID=2683261 RepID=UPI00141282EB|nr:amidohydrolase family protein [Runella sp. CRIBMP]NBB22226.1 amidohydrolase family protein [Runella sp. CRIBMP]